MAREDWRDLESERLRRLRDRDRDDYGQADYSDTYGYDPVHRTGYRAYNDGRRDPYDDRGPFEGARRIDYDDGDRRRDEWDYGPERRRARRDGPSDRVLWAVIMERLEDERRLDISNVEVEVHDCEVTLNGVVRRKADKRRIEDLADIEGIRNVQNNLRVREQRRWMFL